MYLDYGTDGLGSSNRIVSLTQSILSNHLIRKRQYNCNGFSLFEQLIGSVNAAVLSVQEIMSCDRSPLVRKESILDAAGGRFDEFFFKMKIAASRQSSHLAKCIFDEKNIQT